jgi:hypothetical protein
MGQDLTKLLNNFLHPARPASPQADRRPPPRTQLFAGPLEALPPGVRVRAIIIVQLYMENNHRSCYYYSSPRYRRQGRPSSPLGRPKTWDGLRSARSNLTPAEQLVGQGGQLSAEAVRGAKQAAEYTAGGLAVLDVRGLAALGGQRRRRQPLDRFTESQREGEARAAEHSARLATLSRKVESGGNEDAEVQQLAEMMRLRRQLEATLPDIQKLVRKRRSCGLQ